MLPQKLKAFIDFECQVLLPCAHNCLSLIESTFDCCLRSSVAKRRAIPSYKMISFSVEWNVLRLVEFNSYTSLFCESMIWMRAGILSRCSALFRISSFSANFLSTDALVKPCNLIFSFFYDFTFNVSNYCFVSKIPLYATWLLTLLLP